MVLKIPPNSYLHPYKPKVPKIWLSKYAFYEHKFKKKYLFLNENNLDVLMNSQFKPPFFTEEIIQVCTP